MRILVDITHPAHVHFFKHAIRDWAVRGHKVTLCSRDKDLTLPLLDHYGFDHTVLTKARSGILNLCVELLRRSGKLANAVRNERPAVLTGIGGTFIAPVGKLARIPVVIFTDTEHARMSNMIALPLADVICTPACYEHQLGDKQVTYAGYQELAYLHPNRFAPDPSKLEPFGVSPEERYIVMRLVAWASSHDRGDMGFADPRAAVETLCHHARVLISSEYSLPPELMQYGVTVSPEQMHHLLAFATLYIGESATMASESAMLGVPSIFISTSTRGYINDQGLKYGLVYTFSDSRWAQKEGLAKALELLGRPSLRAEWQVKRKRMLTEVTDVTSVIVEIVEKNAKL